MLKLPFATLAAVLAVSSAAYANDLTIKFDRDLLETRNGPEKVMNLIERKVDNYCVTAGPRSLADRKFEKQCKEQTMRTVIRSINHISLNTAYRDVNMELAAR